MTILEQLSAVRRLFNRRLAVIYQQVFYLRLAVVISADKEWFENQFAQIDSLSALVETSIMSSNPRRALQYVCILNHVIGKLEVRVNTIYHSNLGKFLE